jgi:hypothetical protein
LIKETIIHSLPNRSSTSCSTINSAAGNNIASQFLITLPNSSDSKNRVSYCFISYKQIHPNPSKKKRNQSPSQQQPQEMTEDIQYQAFVLISPYPIPYLAFRVLSIIESAYVTVVARLTSRTSPHSTGDPLNELIRLFSSAYDQITQTWPSLALSYGDDGTFGLDVMFPFFEQVTPNCPLCLLSHSCSSSLTILLRIRISFIK